MVRLEQVYPQTASQTWFIPMHLSWSLDHMFALGWTVGWSGGFLASTVGSHRSDWSSYSPASGTPGLLAWRAEPNTQHAFGLVSYRNAFGPSGFMCLASLRIHFQRELCFLLSVRRSLVMWWGIRAVAALRSGTCLSAAWVIIIVCVCVKGWLNRASSPSPGSCVSTDDDTDMLKMTLMGRRLDIQTPRMASPHSSGIQSQAVFWEKCWRKSVYLSENGNMRLWLYLLWCDFQPSLNNLEHCN